MDGEEPNKVFAACVWHEMFDEYTPDTFHPKLLNLPGLVTEVVQIAKLNRKSDLWGKHLHQIQGEIKHSVETGFERSLCSAKEIGLLTELYSAQRPFDVVGLGTVLTLENFGETMEDSIQNRVRSLDFAKEGKSNCNALLSSFGSYAFQRGACSDDTDGVEIMFSMTESKVRNWIASAICSDEATHDCIVAVEVSEDNKVAAIRSICEKGGLERTNSKIQGLPKNRHDLLYLRKKIEAVRPIDAIDKLKAEIRADLNLLALYRHRPAPVILDGGWIVETDGKANLLERSHSFRNLHPRTNALDLATKASAALLPHAEPALHAALDLHSLALSMTDHRLRLANLWSALECLTSVVEGRSIIGRVEQLVVPIVTWRKIDKVVRYLAISIHFWLRSNPEIDRNFLPFEVGKKDLVAPEKLLPILCEPNKSPGIVALLEAVSDHPLLVNRLWEAWKLFHDPNALRANLERSSETLKRHLWRIYRARNLLVHQGIESHYIPQLADHLQHYFSATISRLLHGISKGEHWTAENSWQYWRFQSTHVLYCLKNDPAALILDDLFPENISSPEKQIWTGCAHSSGKS